AGIDAENEIDRCAQRLRNVGVDAGEGGDGDREQPPCQPAGGQAGQRGEPAAGRAQAEGDRETPPGAEDAQVFHGQLSNQSSSRRDASARSSARRAKQRRGNGSPPGPNALPGASPTPASST